MAADVVQRDRSNCAIRITGAVKLKKTFFSPSTTKADAANYNTLSGCITFSCEIGFHTVVASKSLKHALALPYYARLLRSWQLADVFLAVYPYFCRPDFKGNPLRILDKWLIKFLHQLNSKVHSILYVVDLPLEQLLAVQMEHLVDRRSRRVEADIFHGFDILCVFNTFTKRAIMDQYDVPEDNFVEFEILDHIARDVPRAKKALDRSRWEVVYSGNWHRSYVRDWVKDLPQTDNIHYEFTGQDWDWITRLNRKDLLPVGFFPDDERLLEYLSAKVGFGVVYYPDRRKGYANYTSTSKFGTYLVAGLPVLVQSDCAYMTSLVRKYGVGLAFDSLEEIPSLLAGLSQTQYEEMRERCTELGQKLRNGYFFKRAVDASFHKLGIT